MVDAGDEGLTVKEIHQRLKDVPGFESDTRRWAVDKKYSIKSGDDTIFRLGEERIRVRVNNLCKRPMKDENMGEIPQVVGCAVGAVRVYT